MPAKPADDGVTKCRHCGAVPAEEPTSSDWLCNACERYQDFAICPTCGGVTRHSTLSPDAVPDKESNE
jgi:hypothetical protein